uniref:histidinol-phosphate transaminase n=1 Tax=Globisporangium ultimum (strain ATCC 200006 / CBS 805.95 / DAOM BR144) TaxID=431595 RepID=K3WPV4_GLOUD
MDKQSVLALGLTAGLGVGYLFGKTQASASGTKTRKQQPKEASASQDEVERLIRPNILALTPYRCARDDYDQGILLDANENSLGPPLDADHALRQEILERYPDPYQRELKQALANFRNAKSGENKVHINNIFLGVGSDEAIDLVIRVACTPRVDSILITPPTYGMYQVCANIHDVNIISVPLKVEAPAENPKGLKDDLPLPSFHIDPEEILKAATPNTKIIFLCSPGNPTANALRTKDIETVLKAESYKGFVVVDEAYVDFSETASLCTLVNTYPRLIVLQTLSKGFGLAGIRLGSAFGDPRLIQILNNVKAPYNINKLTAKVALEALGNIDELNRKVGIIKSEKERVLKELRKLPFIQAIYASDSNFVLFQLPNSLQVYRQMADRGVVIRYRGNQLLLDDCLRATIGSTEENDRMLALLKEVSIELGATSN